MTGTLINMGAVILGGSIGILLGSRLSKRFHGTIVAGLGLFTLALGVKLFLDTDNALIAAGAIVLGGVMGEWWDIEGRLSKLGEWIEARVSPQRSERRQSQRFISGFLTASLLFLIGPMAILGSIQDGLISDYTLLAVKSIMDGTAALALASTLGIGVLFSILPMLAYQGGISLLAAQAQSLLTEGMIHEMNAVGGLLLVGLALSSLFEIIPIRVGNLLPALLLAPFLVFLIDVI
jgi:uncharacterized membrane protein YqgA involved in biofilm formation